MYPTQERIEQITFFGCYAGELKEGAQRQEKGQANRSAGNETDPVLPKALLDLRSENTIDDGAE
jgi:hypothetical protein